MSQKNSEIGEQWYINHSVYRIQAKASYYACRRCLFNWLKLNTQLINHQNALRARIPLRVIQIRKHIRTMSAGRRLRRSHPLVSLLYSFDFDHGVLVDRLRLALSLDMPKILAYLPPNVAFKSTRIVGRHVQTMPVDTSIMDHMYPFA